jgi:hypothetical protein
MHRKIIPRPNRITEYPISETIKERQNTFFLPITSANIPEGSSNTTTVKEYTPIIIDILLNEAPLSINTKLKTGIKSPIENDLRKTIKEYNFTLIIFYFSSFPFKSALYAIKAYSKG